MPFSVDELLNALTDEHVSKVNKPWGAEFILDLGWTLVKVIRVDAGQMTSLQHHQIKDEVHFVLEGSGTIKGTPDDEYGRPRPSQGYRVYPGEVHRAIGPLLMLEFSTNHPDDVVRHRDKYGRDGRV